jgi:hypothetical protein
MVGHQRISAPDGGTITVEYRHWQQESDHTGDQDRRAYCQIP